MFNFCPDELCRFFVYVRCNICLQISIPRGCVRAVIQNLDPFLRAGRRVTLAKELGLIKFGGSKSEHFEVMASNKQNDSYALFGVMQFDKNTESAAALLAKFMEKEDEILADRFDFVIGVSQSNASSRADKVKLVSDLLSELGADQQRVQRSLSWISDEVLSDCSSASCSDSIPSSLTNIISLS